MKEKQKKKAEPAQPGTEEKRKEKAVGTRGRIFEGVVIRKFPKRLTIEFERTEFIPKYKRYLKKKTRIHARLPEALENEIQIGDLIRVQQCRPLSKIIHFLVLNKVAKETKK